MTVSELIKELSDLPADSEVVIVHRDWAIKKITINKDKTLVELG